MRTATLYATDRRVLHSNRNRDVNKDSRFKAKARTKDLTFKPKARTKDLIFKAKARNKDLTFKPKAR